MSQRDSTLRAPRTSYLGTPESRALAHALEHAPGGMQFLEQCGSLQRVADLFVARLAAERRYIADTGVFRTLQHNAEDA